MQLEGGSGGGSRNAGGLEGSGTGRTGSSDSLPFGRRRLNIDFLEPFTPRSPSSLLLSSNSLITDWMPPLKKLRMLRETLIFCPGTVGFCGGEEPNGYSGIDGVRVGKGIGVLKAEPSLM